MKRIIASSILLMSAFGFSACSEKSAYVQCYEAMLTDESWPRFGDERAAALHCKGGIMSEADLRFCVDKVGEPPGSYSEWRIYNFCIAGS
jgi:hypothetical protein